MELLQSMYSWHGECLFLMWLLLDSIRHRLICSGSLLRKYLLSGPLDSAELLQQQLLTRVEGMDYICI